MRITFQRFPGYANSYSLIERDDGAVYEMAEFTRPGTGMPHDLRHLVTERELGISDGIWGGIASGMVYGSMTYVRGRRPPHAAERSDRLKRAHRLRLMRAELLANLVEAVAALDSPSEDEIRLLTRRKLSVIPLTRPGADPARVVDAPPPGALAAAARAMQVEAARWARLRPGQELVYEWPLTFSSRAPRPLPRQRKPGHRHAV